MSKKIILTGGGTAGHVIPNIAIIPKLKEIGYDIVYIGSRTGIEKELIQAHKIKYYGISTGKLRRYFDMKNFKDPFRIVKGVFEAVKIMRDEKPDIVFSKGGFVAIPVILGAFINKIPIVSHESDITPGLANKIAMPFIKTICTTFPETERYIGSKKIELTGTPIRKELFLGSEIKGKEICKFKNNKPIILVMGGSQGSTFINNLIRKNLDRLLVKFNIIHICGKNNLDNSLDNKEGYIQNEYIKSELPHLFKISSLIISRAGSNSIYEILALRKPNILIPLSRRASRGDQILNAKSFFDRGFSEFIEEEDIKSFDELNNLINKVYDNREMYINNMNINSDNPIKNIINVIVKYSK